MDGGQTIPAAPVGVLLACGGLGGSAAWVGTFRGPGCPHPAAPLSSRGLGIRPRGAGSPLSALGAAGAAGAAEAAAGAAGTPASALGADGRGARPLPLPLGPGAAWPAMCSSSPGPTAAQACGGAGVQGLAVRVRAGGGARRAVGPPSLQAVPLPARIPVSRPCPCIAPPCAVPTRGPAATIASSAGGRAIRSLSRGRTARAPEAHTNGPPSAEHWSQAVDVPGSRASAAWFGLAEAAAAVLHACIHARTPCMLAVLWSRRAALQPRGIPAGPSTSPAGPGRPHQVAEPRAQLQNASRPRPQYERSQLSP